LRASEGGVPGGFADIVEKGRTLLCDSCIIHSGIFVKMPEWIPDAILSAKPYRG
jgi:hypothetical protein